MVDDRIAVLSPSQAAGIISSIRGISQGHSAADRSAHSRKRGREPRTSSSHLARVFVVVGRGWYIAAIAADRLGRKGHVRTGA